MTIPYIDYLITKWIDGYKPKGIEFNGMLSTINTIDDKVQALLDGEFDEAALLLDIENKLSNLERTYEPRLTSAIEGVENVEGRMEYLESRYLPSSPTISENVTVDNDGILKVKNIVNNSLLEIEDVKVNGISFGKLLPAEKIVTNNKMKLYDEYTIKQFSFNNATVTPFVENVDNVRVQIPLPEENTYSTNVNIYNIISESEKFVSEKQTNFTSNPNNFIGVHSSGLIDIKVLKSDVESGGFNWNISGVRSYMATIEDFTFHIRKLEYTNYLFTESILLNAGDNVVIEKLNTTFAEFSYFTGGVSDVENFVENLNVKIGEFTPNGITENNVSEAIKNDRERLEALEEKVKILPYDEYNYKVYEAEVVNRTTKNYVQKQIKIHSEFEIGECLNENCIIVLNSNGEIVPHQWENERNVNPKYDTNIGVHYDSSLKNGYIWIVDDIDSGSTKNYEIRIYPVEVTTPSPFVSSTKNENRVTMETSSLKMEFLRTNKFLSNVVVVNGNSFAFEQDPAYNLTKGGPTTYVRNDSTAVFIDYKLEGSGVIFKELSVRIRKSDWFDFTLKTRLYKNGLIQEKQQFKALREVLATELFGIFQRTNIFVPADANFTNTTTKYFSGNWDNGSLKNNALLVYAQGDLPRTSGGATYPVVGVITNHSTKPNTKVFVGGWRYLATDTAYAIPKDMVFLSAMEFNLIGSDSGENESIRAFNELQSNLSDKTLFKLKNEVMNKVVEITSNTGLDFQKRASGKPFDPYYPSFLNQLALYKMYGNPSLQSISDNYKILINSKFGGNNADDMWNLYLNATYPFSIQFTSRIYPVAYYLKKEFESVGNSSEVTYYTDLLKNYAEVLTRSVEETGRVNMYYNNGFNSNVTAAGMRGLSMGIEMDPSNQRFKDAYDVEKGLWEGFKSAENFVTDGFNFNLSTNQYLHYAYFANFEYMQAIKTRGENPTFNSASHGFVASSSYGALREQEYCISNSRRGTLTYAYIVYCLLVENTVSSVAKANSILKRIVEQNKASGGHVFPFEKWENQESGYDSVVSIELQVLGEILYKLIYDNVSTNL